jgi:hypothetical protein
MPQACQDADDSLRLVDLFEREITLPDDGTAAR